MVDSSVLYRTISVTTTHVEPSTGQDYVEVIPDPEPRDYNIYRPETHLHVDWDDAKQESINQMCTDAYKSLWENVMKAKSGFENEASGSGGGGGCHCDTAKIVKAIDNNTEVSAEKLDEIKEAIKDISSIEDMEPITIDTIESLPDYEPEEK